MLRASRLATATSAAALTLCTGPAALAAGPPSVDQWKVGQTVAAISWVEDDRADTSGRPGNVHVGGLMVERVNGSSVVSAGSLADWDCPAGAMPWDDEGRACALVTQWESTDGEVLLALDLGTGTARVTGSVTFFDLAGVEPDVWTAPVDLAWTTEGKIARTTSHVVELSSTFRFVSHERTATWPTVEASGAVGTMVLGDEAGELNEERLWHSENRFFIWDRTSG